MDIEKEIENLKVQANHNLLTGYEELAEKQNQYAKWFEELLFYKKLGVDLNFKIQLFKKLECCELDSDAVVCCDYGISENCVNPDSYGVICVECGECGRTFKNGIKHPYIKHRRKNET